MTTRLQRGVTVLDDRAALMVSAAQHIAKIAATAVEQRGRFCWALSGGSTPRGIYSLLARMDLDWSRVHFFWGDERCVPPDDRDSNYRMARETLLEAARVPEGNVHRMLGEAVPEVGAADYELRLREFFEVAADGPAPRFDLILLGIGVDGHTASLFPGTAALFETRRWVVANRVDATSAWRLTLTPLVLNAAAQVLFVVAGSDKAPRLKEVLDGPSKDAALPAQLVRPIRGELRWLVDADAARALTP